MKKTDFKITSLGRRVADEVSKELKQGPIKKLRPTQTRDRGDTIVSYLKKSEPYRRYQENKENFIITEEEFRRLIVSTFETSPKALEQNFNYCFDLCREYGEKNSVTSWKSAMSKRVMEDVTKGYKMELMEKIVEMTYDLDLHICGNHIFGLPEDDYDSMNETLKLMLDINAEWANIYCAMACPGSALYELAVEKSWPLPESWSAYSQYAYETLPLPTKYLSGGEVLSFRDYAFEVYYNSPRYLNMIERKFGKKTKSHIKEMASKKLKREYASI